MQIGDQPGGAADLLRHPDHHHRLFPAVHAAAGRGGAVHAHGLSPWASRCSARCSARSRSIPGLAYLAFRKPRRSFRNRPLEWLGARLPSDAGAAARTGRSFPMSRPESAFVAVGGSRRRGRARLSAGSRRGRALAAGPDAERPVARSRQRNGERASPHRAGVSRSPLHHDPARPRGCRRRRLDARRISRRRSG